MAKVFEKGEMVTFIAGQDGKGTFYFTHAIVDSCGAQYMTLRDAKTNKVISRRLPAAVGFHYSCGTFKALSDEAATEICLREAAAYLEQERARLNRCIAAAEMGSPARADMEKMLADLHEPRAVAHSA